MKELRTLEEELINCKLAFEQFPNSQLTWGRSNEFLIAKKLEDYFQILDRTQWNNPLSLRNYRPVKDIKFELYYEYTNVMKPLSKRYWILGESKVEIAKLMEEIRKFYLPKLILQYNNEWPDNLWRGTRI